MKQMSMKCELVSEYAKDVTWEGLTPLLHNQLHIFAEQFRKQYRLLDQVDYILTDSPLILSCVYYQKHLESGLCKFTDPKTHEAMLNLFTQTFSEFDNVNFFVERKKVYQPYGRSQTLEEAIVIDKLIEHYCFGHEIGYKLITSDQAGIGQIISSLEFGNK